MMNDKNDEKSVTRKNLNSLAEYGFSKMITGEPMTNFKNLYIKQFLNACGKIFVDGNSLKDSYLGNSRHSSGPM